MFGTQKNLSLYHTVFQHFESWCMLWKINKDASQVLKQNDRTKYRERILLHPNAKEQTNKNSSVRYCWLSRKGSNTYLKLNPTMTHRSSIESYFHECLDIILVGLCYIGIVFIMDSNDFRKLLNWFIWPVYSKFIYL